MADLIGKVLLSQYRVDSFVAAGGMGAVYRVWDLKRNAPLAMKVLHGELAEDPTIFKRFQREARALQKLAHPNIVGFYGLYQTMDFAFMLERFVDGPSLKDILRRQQGTPLPPMNILIYMEAVCAALNYAHSEGIVHCDVKPSNILIDQSNIYLADFGIARSAKASTGSDLLAGTPSYMAPEQFRNAPVPQTDIYALGVILFEMLTGVPPFRGKYAKSGSTTTEAIHWEHLNLKVPSPRDINHSISPELENVIFRTLDKDPLQRYENPLVFFNVLQTALGLGSINRNPLNVFLCHAHADREPVHALYDRLIKDGVDAWLDKDKLLPGQDWELAIKKAVREADVVVVCLSKQFNQAGFRQKEVRLALDTAMEKPEGEIFIIPARLEECETLNSLRKWHWVDLFESDGYEKLFRALRARADKIGYSLQTIDYDSKHTRLEALESEAIRFELLGDFWNARKTWYEIKRLDPHFPRVDIKISGLERELRPVPSVSYTPSLSVGSRLRTPVLKVWFIAGVLFIILIAIAIFLYLR